MGKESPWGWSRVPISLPWWPDGAVLGEVAPAPQATTLFYTGPLPSCPDLFAALDHSGFLRYMGASGPPLAQMGFGPHPKQMTLPSLHPLFLEHYVFSRSGTPPRCQSLLGSGLDCRGLGCLQHLSLWLQGKRTPPYAELGGYNC